MQISQRDILFILVNAAAGGVIGYLQRAGILAADGAVPPLLLIFVAMAVIEAAGSFLARAPLGGFVALPVRFAALIASFAASMLVARV